MPPRDVESYVVAVAQELESPPFLLAWGYDSTVVASACRSRGMRVALRESFGSCSEALPPMKHLHGRLMSCPLAPKGLISGGRRNCAHRTTASIIFAR
jgi:hypothetical protein